MTFARRLRDEVVKKARSLPMARHAHARLRSFRYAQRIRRFLTEKTGRADRLPSGVVYEATMRCNLKCEFCYVGDLLNLEGEWRQELSLEALRRAFPEQEGLHVNLTGGEIFMRKDIMDVFALFAEKGYACGYITTNGTIIDQARAELASSDRSMVGYTVYLNGELRESGWWYYYLFTLLYKVPEGTWLLVLLSFTALARVRKTGEAWADELGSAAGGLGRAGCPRCLRSVRQPVEARADGPFAGARRNGSRPPNQGSRARRDARCRDRPQGGG